MEGRKDECAFQFVQKILSRAKGCLLVKDYGHAFANYLMLLKVSPQSKNSIKEEFTVSLNEWVAQLDQRGQTKDAFWCYEQALDLWPDNDMVLYNMGAHLFRLGYPDEAASYLRKALQINPDLHSARESLQSIACSVVERWHFRMLNDVARNSGYLGAIQEAIREGYDRVLDIGSGTGLLSMFAVRSGAKSVFTCEMSKTMYDLSCDVLAANQMQDQISLFHKKSHDLRVPEDLPTRVSLVVTETMDAGLLGEHILETLQHAWKYLLIAPPHGRVIPAGATVYAQIIECQSIRKQHRVVSHSFGNLKLEDIDILSKTVCVRESANDEGDLDYEPYTSEKLSAIPGGYRPLTPVFKAAEFDFNSPKDLEKWQSTHNDAMITIPVNCSGQMDAIVTWFDLSLDEQHSLSTGPGCNSCWEQAVFPVHPYQLKDNYVDLGTCSTSVREGDSITVSISFKNNHLSLICHEVSHNALYNGVKGSSCQQSSSKTGFATNKMENMSQDSNSSHVTCELPDLQSIDLNGTGQNYTDQCHIEPNNSTCCFENMNKRTLLTLEENDIAFLNDEKTQKAILSALSNSMMKSNLCSEETGIANSESVVEMADEGTQNSDKPSGLTPPMDDASSNCQRYNLSILDLSQGLSLAGLYAAKLDNASYVCITQDSQDTQHALQCVGKSNALSMESCVKFEAKSNFLHPGASALWDIVVVDLVEPAGVLRHQVLEDIAMVRTYCLKPTGKIIPGEVTVFGMCVESDSLLSDSRVLGDDHTMMLNIATHMNDFKISTQLELTLPTLAYTQLTLPFFLFHLDFNKREEDDAVPPYLSQSKTLTVEITQDGTIMAIPFWFDLGMDKDNHVNTMDRDTHWKQAAFLLDKPVEVKKGQTIIVIATLQDNGIWFDVNT